MDLQNSEEDNKMLKTFQNQLQQGESPITTILLHQRLKFHQVLLTDKRLLIARLNTLGRPVKIESFSYDEMRSSVIAIGKKKKLLTFNWQNKDSFTAEFEANQIEQVRQIASVFPTFGENQMRRSHLEKVEILGWGLFVFAALFAVGLKALFEIQVANFMVMLMFSLAFLMIGGAIIIRKENIRGHTGWNAMLFGVFSMFVGLFFLFTLLRVIFKTLPIN